MQRTCGSCGGPFEAVRGSAKYCSERCKKRAQRGHVFAVADVAPVSPPPAEDALSTGLVGHTERELKEAGRLETSMGQEALLLARRIEAGRDTGAAIAALTKQRREAMALAMAGAESTTKPLDGMRDELAERRARLA